MKYRLTIRYFLWISGFMLFCYLLNTAIDLFNDYHPISWIGDSANELRESTVALLLNLLSLPFVLFVAWLVARRLIAPFRSIVESAERIGAGQFKERLAYHHPGDELGRMVSTLNKAFDEYDANLDRQKRFAANAAHQLRTPLAVMRSAGEICLAKDRTPEHYRDTVGAMLDKIDRLSRTCEQLLELSRLDTPAMRARLARLDPAPEIREACDQFASFAHNRGIALGAHVATGVCIDGISGLIGEIAGNLLDNAIRHAREGGHVDLRWQLATAETAELSVEDDGPGISPSIRSNLFEPFAQAGESQKGSTGLGLALVAEIVRLHRGVVQVETSPLGGARLVARWPAHTLRA